MYEAYPVLGFAEPVSCWTHLGAAAVFLYLSFFLVRRGKGNREHLSILVLFSFACVFLLTMSGVYHLLPREGSARIVLQRLDHAAIYVLIASSITAICSVAFARPWRWIGILIIWLVAITAITLKTIYFNSVSETLGLVFYLCFGWAGLIAVANLLRNHGFAHVSFLIYGGLVYSFGACLEYTGRPVLIQGVIGSHELFHIAVIIGISLHWKFLYDTLPYDSYVGADGVCKWREANSNELPNYSEDSVTISK